MLQFPQYWLGGRSEGVAGGLGDYSLNETAARANRFARLPQIPNTGLDGIAHAFHFDAVLYAAYLRKIAEHAGVKRTEGRIESVRRNSENGHVEAVALEDGTVNDGELFIARSEESSVWKECGSSCKSRWSPNN